MSTKEYYRQWRAKHPGYYAKYNRKRRKEHPGEHYERVKAYRKANPEKQKAHGIINGQIRRGTLKRLPCETCGNPRSHAHHADYSKPLDVTWLCAPCHYKRHRIKASAV